MAEPWKSKYQSERWLGGAQAPRLWWIRRDRTPEASEFWFKQQIKLARERQRSHESIIHKQCFVDYSTWSTNPNSPRATEEQSHWWPKLTDISPRSILAYWRGPKLAESELSDFWAQTGDRSTPLKAPDLDESKSTPGTTRETIDTPIKGQSTPTCRSEVSDNWFEKSEHHQLRCPRESWQGDSKAQRRLSKESWGSNSYTGSEPATQGW